MPKVLYIVATSRAGSTLLSNILGELDGFFAAGETRFLWQRVLQGRLCGCELPVPECPVWGSVLSSDYHDLATIGSLSASQRQALRLRHTPRLLRSSAKQLLRSSSLRRYVDAMTDVYGRLVEITGARVIVDSSGRPSNGAALRLLRGVDPYVLHLVRDPRGVAYSRLRPKPSPDGSGQMATDPAWYTAVDWMATNIAADDVRRHLARARSSFLRYEDLVATPKQAIEEIVGFLGETLTPDPFLDTRTVNLGSNHMVSGNPDRFHQGPVRVRPDVGWLERMPSKDRRITTLITLPMALRYGYAMSPSVPRSHDPSPPSDGADPSSGSLRRRPAG